MHQHRWALECISEQNRQTCILTEPVFSQVPADSELSVSAGGHQKGTSVDEQVGREGTSIRPEPHGDAAN